MESDRARMESAPKCDLVLLQLQCIIGHHAMNEASREGGKEGRREGAKERRWEGAKERRSEGAKERRNERRREGGKEGKWQRGTGLPCVTSSSTSSRVVEFILQALPILSSTPSYNKEG